MLRPILLCRRSLSKSKNFYMRHAVAPGDILLSLNVGTVIHPNTIPETHRPAAVNTSAPNVY